MPKITPRAESNTVTVKTMPGKQKDIPSDWWNGSSKKEIAQKMMGTVIFLKQQNQYRYRQAAIYAQMYGNMPLFGWVGSYMNKMRNMSNQLPLDRPTMSVITSCIDTLVSRISQSKPAPRFLTDNADYKKRNLAKQLNNFTAGEFYQTDAYKLGTQALRDAGVLGTGVIKILEDQEKRVSLERRLCTEILADSNDSFYGAPRQLYELKLIDRAVLMEKFPKYQSQIEKAESAYVDASSDSDKTVADQVMVAEGWHLASGPEAKDGLHAIACTEGIIFDDEWEEPEFPFVFMQYSERLSGVFGQGLAEQLMGTQMEINKLLMTISQAINLVGVPRVFVEDGSKIVKAHLNNNVGSIVTYRGTKPQYEVAPCVPAEMYEQLQRLVDYAYQQSGISQLSANSQKPSGLTSGAAMREYDDLQTDRFASLSRRYDDFYVDLAHQIVSKAKTIAKRDGSYQTVYPNKKNGTKEIDLPDVKLLEDSFVIQCFDSSSLPRDPAGRLQKVTEMMQANLISPQEGRRLLDFADIEQVDKLANAGEERILQCLDKIVEDGEYTPPDPFMDPVQAVELVTQYYNLYAAANLEEEKAQMLRDWFTQVKDLATAAQPPQPAPGQMPGQPPGGQPQANPMQTPQSELIPNVNGTGP